MSDNCNSCSAIGTCSSEGCSTDKQLTEAQKLSNVGKLIAVMSGKGGVGKSAVTGMLAVNLRRQGYKVGVLDADITGPSIPKIFGITERTKVSSSGVIVPQSREGIKIISLNLMLENEDDPVIWRGSMITQLVNQFWTDVIWGELDFLLVDMPPGTGDVPITVFQSLPLDGIVIVTSPQELANMVVRKAIKMAKKYETNFYGLIENMAYIECPDCHKRIEVFGKPKGQEMAQQSVIPFLGELPLDPELAILSDAGKIEDYYSVYFEKITQHLAENF